MQASEISKVLQRLSTIAVKRFLVLGAVIMGVHHQTVIENWAECPAIICLGDPNTEKTLCVRKAAEIISPNAVSALEFKKITVADLRSKVFGRHNIPVLLHDPDEVDVVHVLVEETYEAMTVSNRRERVVPGSSGIVTCNPDFFTKFRAAHGLVDPA